MGPGNWSHLSLPDLPDISTHTTEYLTAGLVLVCFSLFVKSQVVAMSYDIALRKLPTPPGRLPFFGHALALLNGTPWDLMEGWIRMFQGQLVKIQVRV